MAEAVGTALAVFRESVIDRQRREIERLAMEREDLQARMIACFLEYERQVRNASANAIRFAEMLDDARSRVRLYRDGLLDAEQAMSEIASDIGEEEEPEPEMEPEEDEAVGP